MKKELFHKIEQLEKNLNKLLELNSYFNEDIYELLDETINIRNTLEKGTYKVAVIGSFSVGKSTFLNAMIGKNVLYSSAKEATGVITTITNSDKNTAYIYLANGQTIEMPISTFDERKNLNNFLDKDSTEKVKQVDINCTFLDNNEDIVLIDTPGLEGMNKDLLAITKEALKEANATIILSGKRGLTHKELELLQNNNSEFGSIKNKDKFLIINQIGDYYENNSSEEALQKIERVIEEVEEQLLMGQVEGVEVFALDSRDYLWARDNELYNKQLQLSKFNDLKSQEYYKDRSNYENFTDIFFELLKPSKREALFLQDLSEKILEIEDCLEEIDFKLKETSNNKYVEEKFKLESQKSTLIKFNRQLSKELSRDISEYTENYLLAVTTEIKNEQHKIIQNLPQIITILIPTKSYNTPKNHQKVYIEVQQEVKFICEKYKNNLFDFIFNTYSYITKKYNEKLEEINISLPDIEFSQDNFFTSYNKESKPFAPDLTWENHLKIEIAELKGEIVKYKDLIFDKKKYQSQENELTSNLENSIFKWHNETKIKLGERPAPTPILKKVSYTTGILWWKKTISIDEDSCEKDDTKGLEWDNKYDIAYNKYIEQTDSIENNLSYIKKELYKISRYEDKLSKLQTTLQETENQLALHYSQQEELRQKYEENILNQERQSLSFRIKTDISNTFDNFVDNLTKECYLQNYTLKKQLKILLDNILQQETERLTKEIDNILQQIK
ncbi:MAG: hypothetical protein ATN36_07095 [Epulopiscium sp. Nele67-Bin005]|nr:MAG: hypothetical protein ATN36_07095 [Epulopiscium sp. Nele67-Bin005]